MILLATRSPITIDGPSNKRIGSVKLQSCPYNACSFKLSHVLQLTLFTLPAQTKNNLDIVHEKEVPFIGCSMQFSGITGFFPSARCLKIK